MVSIFAAMMLTCAHADEPPDVSGTWRLDYWVVTRNKVPVIGKIKSSSAGWALARIVREEEGWIQQHQVCGGAVHAGLVKSELPLAYLAHVPSKTYTIDLNTDSDHVAFHADTGSFQSGHDPACKLPETADDPCVRDWDEDGQPGATILIKPPLFPWTEVYIAQKTHLVLSGRVRSPDLIEGRVQMRVMHTSVLGASNPMFAQSPEASIVAEESRFTMLRVADTATCAELSPPPAP